MELFMANPASNLTGQVAVVTGSSSGIGRAIALELAAAGADVLVHAGKNRDAAQAVANAIAAVGRHSEVVLADLTDPLQQDAFCEQAWRWTGHIDLWVNNAGADVLTGPAAAWPFEQKLEQLWRVDSVASMRLARAIGTRMKARGQGVIINIGWDQAETGMAGDSGELFAAIKGAVMAFTRSLAQSLAPHVRVNCVAPGWIKTAWGERASAAWQKRARRESLLDRWGTPEDVARVVRFLASADAAFITGQVICVNGGMRRG
jgi:3-oxoacyl-[acyl-carrier protein] reductase